MTQNRVNYVLNGEHEVERWQCRLKQNRFLKAKAKENDFTLFTALFTRYVSDKS